MPGLMEPPAPVRPPLGYSIAHQKVELDIDFETQSLKGKTEITIHPDYKDLKFIRLNFSQGEIRRLTVNGKAATIKYSNPYDSLRLYGAHQYHRLSSSLAPLLRSPPEPELIITVPKSVRIEELDPFSFEAQNQLLLRAADDLGSKVPDTSLPKFTAVTINVEYYIERPRDGLQFVGVETGDLRYPHVFNTCSYLTGGSRCLFPCLEDINSRCTWDISIKCSRTIGDAFNRQPKGTTTTTTSHTLSASGVASEDDTLDMVVACSGDMTDEIVDTKDPSKKTVSFACSSPISAQQVGFAVGPFEYINLAEFRESDEDEQLGQNAVPVHAFCLPGRADEVRNTCFPMAKAIDFISLTYGSYPFSSYKMCFVDDLSADATAYAALSVCSNRILFPEDILDPLYDSTRSLVHALASQWMGVNIIPKEPTDIWAVVGIAYYITDTVMKKLCGNNEYRFRLKQMADRVCELDVSRPSISDMGALLQLDSSEMEFISSKAPLVIFILERRLSKASGKATISRVISRIFLNARMGDIPNSALTTALFQKLCERLGHAKLDPFFQQWVHSAGYPRFQATQRFNKKKLVVEMMIRQVQNDSKPSRDLEKSTFMREVKEEIHNVYEAHVPTVFTGSMTIRIHEADGTPYEHIVEIKEGVTKFDIPYNTKYKRLKRNKRQKERATAAPGADPNTDTQDDTLLYCLGDVLQTDDEMRRWKLAEWTREEEMQMGQESYEWIRMDADFEWICKLSLNMPGYMYLSQLQQDRDVVAQLESVQYMAAQKQHRMVSTILVRTVMDRRYFHGIRTTAARALVSQAKEEVDWIGLHHLETAFQDLFCLPNSPMVRSNNFEDRASYALQLALPRAIALVRNSQGKTPMRVKKFLYEKLKFNDNSNNELSDCFYVATLMKSIAEAISGGKETVSSTHDALAFDMEREIESQAEDQLYRDCMAEINRYRRMDEWTSSFQNIYTRTALDCQRSFMRSGVVDTDVAQFLPYTRAGTFDLLRLKAFEILAGLDILQRPELLEWFIYVMATDPSPWTRKSLFDIFGLALATVAIGEERKEVQTAPTSELVIEQESSTDARKSQLARQQSVPGALDALKHDLGSNATLKGALWAAANSPRPGLLELSDYVDLCSILYDPIDNMMVSLRYPRYWKAEHLGKGNVRFYKSDRFRTKPISKLGTAPSSSTQTHKRKREDVGTPQPSRRITLKVGGKLMAATPSREAPPSNSQPPPAPSGQPKLKLKFNKFPSTQ